MLHPVGPLPARVYWRRRLLVLGLLVSLLGGGGWTGWAAWSGRLPVHLSTASAQAPAPAAATAAAPALTGVLPSLAGVRVPVVPPPAPSATGTPAAVPAATATPPAPPAAVAGPPCTDDMIGLTLAAPRSATVGGSAVFTLTVIDTSVLPCARDVGTAEQEVVLLDAAGGRVWSSADCTPPAAAPKLFAAGERVDVDVAWDGQTSSAGCAGPRAGVPAGSYVLRGRLGTRTAADVPLTLG